MIKKIFKNNSNKKLVQNTFCTIPRFVEFVPGKLQLARNRLLLVYNIVGCKVSALQRMQVHSGAGIPSHIQ